MSAVLLNAALLIGFRVYSHDHERTKRPNSSLYALSNHRSRSRCPSYHYTVAMVFGRSQRAWSLLNFCDFECSVTNNCKSYSLAARYDSVARNNGIDCVLYSIQSLVFPCDGKASGQYYFDLGCTFLEVSSAMIVGS